MIAAVPFSEAATFGDSLRRSIIAFDLNALP
jgi:hypothetical protein